MKFAQRRDVDAGDAGDDASVIVLVEGSGAGLRRALVSARVAA